MGHAYRWESWALLKLQSLAYSTLQAWWISWYFFFQRTWESLSCTWSFYCSHCIGANNFTGFVVQTYITLKFKMKERLHKYRFLTFFVAFPKCSFYNIHIHFFSLSIYLCTCYHYYLKLLYLSQLDFAIFLCWQNYHSRGIINYMQGRPAEAIEDFRVLVNDNDCYYFSVWFEWFLYKFYKLHES